jgi:hypothetical protein
MLEVFDNMRSMSLDFTVVNNLGFAATVELINPPATTPLGSIGLSGQSSILFSKDQIAVIPFSPIINTYLNEKQTFSIIRLPENQKAIDMSLGITIQTDIKQTF